MMEKYAAAFWKMENTCLIKDDSSIEFVTAGIVTYCVRLGSVLTSSSGSWKTGTCTCCLCVHTESY